jgi:hypothetical protein
MNLFTTVFLALIALLAIMYVFKSRIVITMHWILKFLFVLLIVLSLSALFVPQFFSSAADATLHSLGTYGTIESADSQIGQVTNAPQSVIDGISNLFNPDSQQTPSGSETNPGWLLGQVYPGLVSGLGLIYRLMALFGSVIGLVVVVYLSYTIDASVEVAKLKKQVEELSSENSKNYLRRLHDS